MPIVVLHRDAHLLVVSKPAGLATTSPEGSDSLARRVVGLDPGAPRLHPTSRLDAEVTGVVTFARTRRATKALLAARKRGAYQRLYLGLAAHTPTPPSGHWGGVIGLDPRDRRKRILMPAGGDGQAAATDYAVAATGAHACLLHLRPHTGRTHQLRVHATSAGVPLLGDRPYGGPSRMVLPDGRAIRVLRVMLHCARVSLPDPEGAGMHTFVAPIPDDFRDLWTGLGGDAAALVVPPD